MNRTRSGKKAHRASLSKRVFNARRKTALKTALKKAHRSLASGAAAAEKEMPALYQAIDKAAKRGVIKKRAAARMKSRAAKRVFALAKK